MTHSKHEDNCKCDDLGKGCNCGGCEKGGSDSKEDECTCINGGGCSCQKCECSKTDCNCTNGSDCSCDNCECKNENKCNHCEDDNDHNYHDQSTNIANQMLDNYHKSTAVEETSKLSDYLPLAIVFTYIIAGTLLLSLLREDYSPMILMGNFMGLFFGIFSLFKLIDLKGFAAGYSTYDVIARRFRQYAYAYPFIEAGLAILYLLMFNHPALHIFTLVLMLVSSIGIAQSLMRKTKIVCACLGNVLKVPLSTVSLLENLLMAAMSLFMLIQTTSNTNNVQYSNLESKHCVTHESMMEHAQITNDKKFLEAMIPHHQEAVETSNLILSKSSNAELKAFATNVVNDQQKEIDDMVAWYAKWYGSEYKDNGSYQAMMGDLDAYTAEELDIKYIEGMILHHQGAIKMARQVLEVTKEAEIEQLAQSIIQNQIKEINYLGSITK